MNLHATYFYDDISFCLYFDKLNMTKVVSLGMSKANSYLAAVIGNDHPFPFYFFKE